MNKSEVQQKIDELENWLKSRSPEDEARPQVEADLRKLKEKQTHQEYD